MDQIKLIGDIAKAISKQKKDVPLRIFNVILKCANELIFEIERPERKSVPGMGLKAWLQSDDTGLSSKYMAHILCGGPETEYALPQDSDDFGRCYRFLLACPSRGTGRMSECSPQWKYLEKAWPELVRLYEEKKFEKLNKEIQEAIK